MVSRLAKREREWKSRVMDRPVDLGLSLEWAFGAPPSRVFAMFTEPAELAKWWGPHGFTTPEIKIDPNPGGRYRFTMQPPEGEPFHVSGEYLEIDPPTRLVLTFNWEEPDPDDRETVVRISLDAVDGGTKVALWQGTFATEERLELHRGGWSDSFEKLRAVLELPE